MNKLTNSILAASFCLAGVTTAAPVTWTATPATSASEVSNAGSTQWAYYFNSTVGRPAIVNVNGVDFIRVSAGDSSSSPGLLRGSNNTGTNFEDNNDFYLGPDANLNNILDGVTWGANGQFQVTGLNPGSDYQLQIFSSDDRASQAGRVLDIDGSWSTPNGSRQLENIDYTAGAAWTDPLSRRKAFLGTFTADAITQDFFAIIDDGGTGQIDMNAAQLRLIPVPEPASMLTCAAGLGLLALRRRRI